MRVLVLGGTGSVGRRIVQQGPACGHQLTVLARSPEKMVQPHGGLRIVEGDALRLASVDSAMAAQDAVIYALGARARHTTLFSESTRILIGAMRKHGVRRLVAITGVGAGDTKGHGGFLYDRVIYPLFTKGLYEDKDRQETLIRNSDLDWVLVRPAPLREGKQRGPMQAVVHVGDITLRSISRDEVATFVLKQLESDRYLRQAPFIGHA